MAISEGDRTVIHTMGVMLRFGGVLVSQEKLEEELGRPVQWARRSRDGQQCAQFDALPSSERVEWGAIERFLENAGEGVARLIKSGAVLSAELDIGLPFHERQLMSSITMPGRVCYLAGSKGISLTVTYYATSQDDEATTGP